MRDNGMVMLRMLLEHGADPFLENSREGRNAVQMAVRRGRGDLFELLDELGVTRS